MENTFLLPITAVVLLALTGCNSTPDTSTDPNFFPADVHSNMLVSSDEPEAQTNEPQTPAIKAPKGQVNRWATAIANELVAHNDSLRSDQPLVIATPVLTGNFNQTNALGMQLQQGLISAFHKQYFNVVDINVASNIRVTEQGEFLLSRDWQQLASDLPVAHVLVSTMELTREGVVYNGRIVNVTNNRVVSTTQSFVAGNSLSGYLQPPQKIEQRDGLIYRHADASHGRYTVLGDAK
ncbi:FlgO family outer membrane protein [Shewanella maritima]|uniref:FlgO family outer membrane protein n=1 Tax=Shewanella maritima TaxID=2520507 RepID=UPI003735CEB8